MKQIDQDLIQKMCKTAAESPRLRSHHNIHDDLEEDIQRLLIGMQPGTYIRPHYHPEEYKKEMIILLQGACTCVTFDKEGNITGSTHLSRDKSMICEFPDQQFHSLICTEKDTVVLEVKRGPYIPLEAKCFAQWSPESESEASEYIQRLIEFTEA